MTHVRKELRSQLEDSEKIQKGAGKSYIPRLAGQRVQVRPAEPINQGRVAGNRTTAEASLK